MVTRRDSEPRNKNIPLGLELHTFFNLQRSKTTYSIGKEGEHNEVTRLYPHLAMSNEDFNKIFDREISRKVKKEELGDEVTRDLFRRTLYDIVRIYLVRYREFSSLYPDRRSLDKEKAAELFLVWLTAKKTPSEPNISSDINGIFQPKIGEDIIETLYAQLGSYFEPKEQFMNFLTGNQIDGKINFMANQNKLAGIFIRLKTDNEIMLGTHQQTFDFIKQTFLIKGNTIKTQQILTYLKDSSRANSKTFIDISI